MTTTRRPFVSPITEGYNGFPAVRSSHLRGYHRVAMRKQQIEPVLLSHSIQRGKIMRATPQHYSKHEQWRGFGSRFRSYRSRLEAKGYTMAKVVKVIEVLAQSETSWEDAAKNAIEEASKSLRHIRSIYIKNFEAAVENGQITEYRINAKISFLLEAEHGAEGAHLPRQGSGVD